MKESAHGRHIMALNNNWTSPNVEFVMKVSILVGVKFKHWESFFCSFFDNIHDFRHHRLFEMVAHCKKYLERSAIWKVRTQERKEKLLGSCDWDGSRLDLLAAGRWWLHSCTAVRIIIVIVIVITIIDPLSARRWDGENDVDDCDKDDDYNNCSGKVTMERMLMTCTSLYCKAVTHMFATLDRCWTWCLPAPPSAARPPSWGWAGPSPPSPPPSHHPEIEFEDRVHHGEHGMVLWLKMALSMLFMIIMNLTRCWVTAILHSTRSSSQLWKI